MSDLYQNVKDMIAPMPQTSTPLRLAMPPKASTADAEAQAWGLDVEADAFFFDVDGTLLDIADHPDGVAVPGSLAADLERLRLRAGGAVALVSGRTVARLDAIFDPLRLVAAGAHGAEMRLQPEGAVERMSPHLPAETRAEAHGVARDLGGLLVEDKGTSLAIHYRARPEARQDLADRLADLAARAPAPLTVLPGHMVFELKHAGRNKGVAIEALMGLDPFAGRRPVFFGDDVTDEAGFAAVRRLGGLPISVGRAFENVDVVLARAADVRALVHRLSL